MTFDFDGIQCRLRGCENMATHVLTFDDKINDEWYVCPECFTSLAEAVAEQEAIAIIKRMKASVAP